MPRVFLTVAFAVWSIFATVIVATVTIPLALSVAGAL
jgi:hypothetical protein